jgi:hypothetical protein
LVGAARRIKTSLLVLQDRLEAARDFSAFCPRALRPRPWRPLPGPSQHESRIGYGRRALHPADAPALEACTLPLRANEWSWSDPSTPGAGLTLTPPYGIGLTNFRQLLLERMSNGACHRTSGAHDEVQVFQGVRRKLGENPSESPSLYARQRCDKALCAERLEVRLPIMIGDFVSADTRLRTFAMAFCRCWLPIFPPTRRQLMLEQMKNKITPPSTTNPTMAEPAEQRYLLPDQTDG